MLESLYNLSRNSLNNQKREYIRYFIKEQDLSHRLTIVTGQRGVGKSTAMVQYLLENYSLDSDKILYLPVDHFSVKPYALYEIAEQFQQLGGECLCFDEIHKNPDWSIALKSIYDTFPKLKILATGSSALLIHKGSHDLSRRSIVYHMKGMSFREYLELELNITLASYSLAQILRDHEKLSRIIIHELEQNDQKVLRHFKHYLQWGYYPYFTEFTNKELFYLTVEQNIHTTLESDLINVYPSLSGASIKKMEQLLAFIATSVPFVPDFSKLKKLLTIGDERTLKTYLQYLENAGLILQIVKGQKGLKMLERPGKIYLNNSTQFYALAKFNKIEMGTVREMFFANMLHKQQALSIPKYGDFNVNNEMVFEIGGKNKSFDQIKNVSNAYIVCDDIENGYQRKIPLWLFGFLY